VARIAAKKLKKSREDLDYDPADIEDHRKRFQDQSYQDYNYVSLPEANERTERPPYLDEDYSAPSTDERIPPPPVVHAQPVSLPPGKLDSSFGSHTAPDNPLPNGTARKRNYDEMEDDSDGLSSVLSNTPPPPPPSAFVKQLRAESRAGTPGVAKNPAITKARKSARVMVS
jgi:hypothetical protein